MSDRSPDAPLAPEAHQVGGPGIGALDRFVQDRDCLFVERHLCMLLYRYAITYAVVAYRSSLASPYQHIYPTRRRLMSSQPSRMMPSDAMQSQVEGAIPPMTSLRNISPLRMAKMYSPEEYVDRARYEIATVLYFWGFRPEMWTILGFTASATSRLSSAMPVAHPIVDVMQSPVIMRCQPLSLSERDTIARHAFMRHLAAHGLPVPELKVRPDASTYAVVPFVPLTDPQQASGFTYALDNAIYELQAYVPGRRFVTDGPAEDTYLEAAAQTLARLHNASREFPGPGHRWPGERSSHAIAQTYLSLIADASRAAGISRSVATCLRRLAREGAQRIPSAAAHLAAQKTLPRLHIHGDYQPHNLAFDGDRVVAIYDFDAMHEEWRVIELAYALLAFTGVRWGDDAAASVNAATPPLVARGLDLERATAFLSAYGRIAPPQPAEVDCLGDALLLTLPVVFANGVAEDLVFPEREARLAESARGARAHVEWAETFPAWLETNQAALRDAWARHSAH